MRYTETLQFAAALVLWATTAATSLAADSSPDRVMVLVKFTPPAGQSAPKIVPFAADSCRACEQLHDPAFERFNTKEAVLQLAVPRGRFLSLAFDIGPSQVQRVIVNDSDLVTRREGARLIAELPPLWSDAVWAPALETDITEPGMVLRVETADPVRRAGPYAGGPFPTVQRRAADNLGFAQREVVRRLGLGAAVEAAGTGSIMIMGFDTNFPAGHADAPPHVHMHLRWANNVGTQIGHYYLSEDGLLTENRVGVRGLNAPARTYKRGEPFTTIDNRGQPVYAHTITDAGYLKIERPDGAACQLSPSGQGFQDGVIVDCGSLGTARISTSIDVAAAVITVHTDDIVETLRYDAETGRLLTRAAAPDVPTSARNPD